MLALAAQKIVIDTQIDIEKFKTFLLHEDKVG